MPQSFDYVDFIFKILPIITALIVWFFKDKILHLLNVELKKNEIEYSTTQNLESNLSLYQKILDDYQERMNRVNEALENRIIHLESEIDTIMRERDEKIEENRNLVNKVNEIKAMLEKSLKALDYYREHSKIELPPNLTPGG